MKIALIYGLIGATLGCCFSFLVNYYLVPMPSTIFGNALGNGISGVMSGFMGGFFGVRAYIRKMDKQD